MYIQGNYVDNELDNQTMFTSTEDMKNDFSFDFSKSGLGYGDLVTLFLGKVVAPIVKKLGTATEVKTPYIKQVDKVIDRQTRLTNNPKQTNPSRIKAKEKILKEVVAHKDSEIAKTSASVGATTSGAGTAIGNKIVDADDNDK